MSFQSIVPKRILKCVIPILFVVSQAAGQWTDNPLVNTPVDTSAKDQTSPRMVSDGLGGMIVVWQDNRDSATTGVDLYAKRLNQNGIAVWTAALCKAAGDQLTPAVVPDGQGGAIIAWSDPRNGNADIYAQRITNLGAVLWKPNGADICTDTSNQAEVSVTPDGLGGAILGWKDFRNGINNADIYAQRISPGGIIQWAVDGDTVCTATGEQALPRLAGDGFNGAIVTWQDARAGVNTDVYAQHLQSTGTADWTANGVVVSATTGRQRNPVILADGEQGAYIVWEDTRSGNSDIYAHRVDDDGSIHAGWAVNGVAVCTEAGEQTLPALTGAGVGGLIIAWQDTRNVNEDIYAQGMNGDGVPLWTSGGVAVSTAADQQLFPVITDDGLDGAIVAWQDNRGGNGDIYAQSVSSAGTPRWTADGVPISTESHDQELPAIASDGSRGAIMAWQDHRSAASYNIYAQIVNSSGILGLISISGIVFNDREDNGIFDITDTRLAGWRVTLTGPSSGADTTDAQGAYAFTNLSPGNYTVKVEDRTGWKHTYPNSTGDSSLALDSTISGVNFGNFELATISGRIYHDRNENGIIEAGEPPFNQAQRWRVKLGGVVTREMDTDNNGNYRFTGLASGEYFVTVVPQQFWIQTAPVDTPRPTLTHGQDTTFDFGFFRLGQISGQIFTDHTADSVLDGRDSSKPLNGWTVRLYKDGIFQTQSVTSGNGNYAFTGLHIGSYAVKESTLAGWVQTRPDTFYTDSISTGAQTRSGRDFANFRMGTISGNLYFDVNADSSVTGDNGLKGWSVRLFDTLGALRKTAATNTAGFYAFDSLMPGRYVVAESVQAGWSQTFPKPPLPPGPLNKDTMVVVDSVAGVTPGDQRAYLVTIDTSGRNRSRRSFGNFRRGQIAGTVFNDMNDDGGKDAGEPGLKDWQLLLTGTESSGQSVSRSILSDTSGAFLFASLAGGNYTVKIVRKPGWKITRPTTTDEYSIHLSVGEVAAGRDFGSRLAGALHGQVFLDWSGDGEKSEADSGLPGRRLLLVNPSSGWVLDSTLTDADGMFLFDTLVLGLYRVDQRLEPGWKKITPLFPVEIRDLEETDPMQIANFQLGTISGKVFDDLNGDGLNTAEPPFPGCPMILRMKVNDTTEMTIAEIHTDTAGGFAFSSLERGTYSILVATPVGWKQTAPASGYIDSVTSSGQSITGLDFGGYYWNTIAGSVFFDANGNGTKDNGEATIPDWTVLLSADGGPVTDSTRTAANGMYQFTGLPAGTFSVTTVVPPGYYQTLPDSIGGQTVTAVASPEEITGVDFGYYPGAISGIAFNDLNGDGVFDPGETGLNNWTVTLGGTASRTAQTDSLGVFLIQGLKPGAYTVQIENRSGWIHTSPDSTGMVPVQLDSATASYGGIEFGNFQLTTISGIMFEDANRNGTRDLGEVVMTNRTVTLTWGLSSVSTITNGSGSYLFTGIRGGEYAVGEQIPPGYDQSFPPHPGTHTLTSYSGESAVNRNFGNYQSLPNAIAVRCFRDNDGDFTTPADATAKPWFLRLYHDSVSAGTIVSPTSSTTSSIYFTNLAPDTYIATMADSAGWTHLGRIVDGTASAGPYSADTLQLLSGESHQVNMIVFRPNSILVRALSDSDGVYGTAGDRDTLPWDLSLYRKFVAPANLVAAEAGVESLFVENLGNQTYVAVERDSSGWKHIGTIPGDTGSANFRSVVLTGGTSATVEFVNTEVGSVLVRAWRDEDAGASTADDRDTIAWRLRVYRNTEIPANLVAEDSAESLLLSDLGPGTYIVTQSASHGGAAWNHIGTIVDGAMDSTLKSLKATILLAGGAERSVEFVNFDPRRKKTWTAAEDGQWVNARNWSPPFLPRTIDTVVIASTALPCIPVMPPGLSQPSLVINQNGMLKITGPDTIRRDIRIDGTLIADTGSLPAMTVGRNWEGTGSFLPGGSLVEFTRGLTHSVTGMFFHDIHLDTNTTGQPWNLHTSGNLSVTGTLGLLGDLDIGSDTLFILSDDGGAVTDSGRIVGGTMSRAIRPDTAGIRYRFESDSTYVLFTDTAGIPPTVAMRAYRQTAASSFGDAWEVLGVNPRRSARSVAVDSVTRLSRLRALTLGRMIAGKPTPTINRVYFIQAAGDSGFVATLSLRYESGEVSGIPMPDSLLILAMKFAVRDSVARGWNMVSVPVVPDDFRKIKIFPAATSGAFRFNPAGPPAYALCDTLENGTGYWVKFGKDTIASIVGAVRLEDTLTLFRGWNIVGALSEPVEAASLLFLPPNLGRGEFFGFERGYGIADVLMPMKSYWVNVSDSGSVIMTAQAGSAVPKAAVAPAPRAELDALGTITFTDASGGRTELRFGKGAPPSSPHRFALPPPGPGGVLDARFSTGTMRETYRASVDSIQVFDILVSPGEYPVTVTWELTTDPEETITLSGAAGGGLAGVMPMRDRGAVTISDPSVTRLRISVDAPSSLPTAYALHQCYPNPFNPATTIRYELPEPSWVTLKVYDILGREVEVLVSGQFRQAGRFEEVFDASGRASGVYFYRITAQGAAAGFERVMKMLLLK